jgi:hypothetical protein
MSLYSAPPASAARMSAGEPLAPIPTPQPVHRGRLYQAIGGLAATLVVGLLPFNAATGLFIIMAGVSFFLVRRAFPAMWLHGVWLAAIYALAFLGATLFALTAAVRSPLAGPVPIFGLAVVILEGLALYAGLALFAEIKSIRDFRTRLSIARGDEDPEYTRIGLWTLALIAFFLFSNLSALLFVAWARGAPVLPAHAAVEALLIGLAVFVLYLPESAFGVMPKDYKDAARAPEREGLLTRLLADRPKPAAGAVKEGDRCPVCAGALEFSERKCPSCAAATRVGWCPKSEVHVVDCEHCGKPVVYGKPVCEHCKRELREAVYCRACKTHAPLRDWKGAAA